MNIAPRIDAYLKGSRYTLWTFIKYFEKSKDSAHCRRVRANMREALRKMHREGKAIRCRSIRGGVSYRPAPEGCPF